MKESTCQICTMLEETTCHVLWTCPTTQNVWSQSCVKLQSTSFHPSNFVDIWYLISHKLDPLELSETAILLRSIWHKHNEISHRKAFLHPSQLIKQAQAKLTQVLQVQDIHSISHISNPSGNQSP